MCSWVSLSGGDGWWSVEAVPDRSGGWPLVPESVFGDGGGHAVLLADGQGDSEGQMVAAAGVQAFCVDRVHAFGEQGVVESHHLRHRRMDTSQEGIGRNGGNFNACLGSGHLSSPYFEVDGI
jgi:hypothetical protein